MAREIIDMAVAHQIDAAAIVCARAAHQVHGAIGVTMEYPLQRFTRRLWEWEAGDGTAMRWARRLGADALAGPMRMWQLITGIRS